MDRFEDLQAYVAVVEAGTFTAAADRLGVDNAEHVLEVLQMERFVQLHAVVEADPQGGLYRSDDAGESWRLMSMLSPIRMSFPLTSTTWPLAAASMVR